MLSYLLTITERLKHVVMNQPSFFVKKAIRAERQRLFEMSLISVQSVNIHLDLCTSFDCVAFDFDISLC